MGWEETLNQEGSQSFPDTCYLGLKFSNNFPTAGS